MFNIIQGLAMAIFVITLTFYGKCYGFSKFKSFIMGMISLISGYTIILFVTWVENGFTNWGAQNAVRSFVFNPLLNYIIAKVMKVDLRKFNDFAAFPVMLWYGVGHLACIFPGCCHGFAYNEGTFMYNIAYALTGSNMLPQQLIESIGALLIAAILLLIGLNYNFKTNGYMYYIMLILYGSQRFFFEFFRDNKKVIVFKEMISADGEIGISNLALWALAMFIEGIVLLIIFVRSDKKRKLEMQTVDNV